MTMRKRYRIVLYAVLVVVLAALTAQTASAVTSGRKTISNSPRACVQSESHFNWSPYTPGTFGEWAARGETYARTGGSCAATLPEPNGSIATRLQVFKYDGTNWNVCRETPWSYGGTNGDVHQGDLTLEQRGAQSAFYSPHQPPCGPGYYGTMTSSYVATSSGWEGTGLWSGNTYAS